MIPSPFPHNLTPWIVALAMTQPAMAPGADNDLTALDAALRRLDTNVLAEDSRRELSAMLEAHARAGIEAANRRETRIWREVKSREDWERHRDARLAALRESLGTPPPAADLKVRATRTIQGDDYRIENLVFESRPGLAVTANLYLPPAPAKPMPGILICHSHHHPKEEPELQDMGVAWARAGCAVLVMDQLGHGERRQHPFRDAKSYPGSFRAGRQDYYFRYNTGLQLHLAGESLMGWMVGDLLRGVDLLLSRPGIDASRIVLLGSVAGGGDPAAVAAALDRRIAAAAPFNFGGPQPETRYPLPADVEESFNYAGGGSWESTRNLRLSARDGFLPWMIVGSVAPRGLIYAHEFSWDRERDPVWRRLETIYDFHGARARLAFAIGRGTLSGQSPEATHCNNIGVEHRRYIHQAFERWLDITPPADDRRERRPPEELRCLSEEAALELRPRLLHEILLALGRARAAEARRSLESLPVEARRAELRSRWTKLLGDVQPATDARVVERRSEGVAGMVLERVLLETEEEVAVPLILLLPADESRGRAPVVVAFAQEGKRTFLERRRGAAAAILQGGAALCLPDLRGTGETRPEGDDRGRRSESTAISSTYLMLGRTLLGSRLQDLRSVLGFLRRHPRIDGSRVALWGDSFAPASSSDRNVNVPLDAEPSPDLAEPLGGVLAVLAGLFDDGARAVYARGGIESYESLLASPFVHVPRDVIVPGALLAGDLPAVLSALAPGSVLQDGAVDGLNRRVRESPTLEESRIAGWMLSRL